MTGDQEEYHIEVIPHQQNGGQHVGVVWSDIRVTHIPTGIVAQCGYERSQHKNKLVCMNMIEWALLELKLK